MTKSIPNNGLIYFRGFLNADHLLLTSPQAITEVLVRRPYVFTKPTAARNLLRRISGNSLLVAEGDEHKHLRKNMQPFFNFRNIQDLYPVFWSKSIDMTEAIRHSAPPDNGASIITDINLWANKATLDAIGVAVLGRDFNTLKNTNDELVKHYETVTTTKWDVQAVFIANAFLPRWTLRLIPGGIDKRITAAAAELRRVCREFLLERKKDVGRGSQKDILLQLIKSNAFSDEELIDQLLTFIGAGQGYHFIN
jgi:cytochrome P450